MTWTHRFNIAIVALWLTLWLHAMFMHARAIIETDTSLLWLMWVFAWMIICALVLGVEISFVVSDYLA